MSSRIRHPAKSFALFVLVVVGGYLAWENRHMLAMEKKEFLTDEQRMDIREQVIVKFQKNPHFLGFRALSWRPNEGRYFIDIEVSDELDDAKPLCFEIAEFIEATAEVESTVIARDSTGREVGRAIL
ncbi:MAG: hypothetical protein QNJ98_01340 [Planctomycetota bacterium]|nr:hypothetical protein [Planctomycetota bacterium]